MVEVMALWAMEQKGGGGWVTGFCSCIAAMTTTRVLKSDLNIFPACPTTSNGGELSFTLQVVQIVKGGKCYNTNKILINFKVRQSP